MNTYLKYCPNVFVAKCKNEYKKGDVIIITTKYGKEHESEIHNYLDKTRDGFNLYSVTRTDGFNTQERAKNKAEKLNGYASNAETRSVKYYEASKEGRDFLSLGEPIKIGHHSEKRHRKLIERNWNRMSKSVEESEKAEEYKRRAEYWESKTDIINLSMPESLGYYEFKLEEAKKNHQFLKDNPDKRAHSFSLTYANKEVKETQKNLDLAVKLWGDEEYINQIEQEKKEQAETKASKNKKLDNLLKKYGGFFAFNNEQFRKGYAIILNSGHLEEGEKVTHIKAGLYVPSKNVEEFIQAM